MRTTIREISHGVFDGPHATPPPSETGAVFLGIGAIGTDGYIDESKAKRISEEDFPKWTRRVTPQAGDIVFSYEATLNLYAIIPSEFRGCLGRRIGLIRPDTSKVNTKFLFYYFYSPQWRSLIKSKIVQGATVDRISIEDFPDFSLELPSLETQNRIVQILEPYDSLIENNRRQIKLLEEAAQRLYKEWFVDLRFPGHEHTPIIDGIPQGWKMARFGDEIDYVRGRSYSSKELSDKGECLLINLKNIRSHGGYLPGGEKGYIGEYKTEQCAHLGDLIMSVTDMTHERRLVGHVALVPQLKSTAIISMDLIKLIPRAFPVSYIYSVFNYGKLDEQAAQYANGTNVLHLKPSCLADLEFVSPPNAILEKYDDFFCALMGMMNALYAENASLTEARERLLPKLMSGEVEV